MSFDDEIAAIAITQHSLFTLADVRAVGGTKHHANTRCHAGRWENPYPGVYRISGVPWTYEARVLAAVMGAGKRARASHFCACRLHGIGFNTAGIELTVPRGRRCFSEGITVHTSTDLARSDEDFRVHGIPVTDPDRTLLDVARRLRPVAFGKAVESGRRLELVTWSSLVSCLTAHARRGRPGVQNLRSLIATGTANDEVTDTDSELLALSLFREFGFPEPVLQHRIWSPQGQLLAEMDFAYLDRLVNFEINGSIHLLPEVIRKDDERDHMLRQMGWTIRRIWWEIPVRQPDEFIRIVRSTLRDARPVSL